jgi:hypothetical protein
MFEIIIFFNNSEFLTGHQLKGILIFGKSIGYTIKKMKLSYSYFLKGIE